MVWTRPIVSTVLVVLVVHVSTANDEKLRKRRDGSGGQTSRTLCASTAKRAQRCGVLRESVGDNRGWACGEGCLLCRLENNGLGSMSGIVARGVDTTLVGSVLVALELTQTGLRP
ncbi:hypothetical protein EDD17DRAFT_1009699 [Pisolithus thermaeus]|nr:hypothetical protein EDD17DRAFT_1009699 [Pisolithus thermaeus]